MRSRSIFAAIVLASLLAGAAPAAGQDVARYGPAHIAQAAPFYLYPDESKKPLEALKPGTKVTVVEIEGDWLLVEYEDPSHGVRQGYVKSRMVKPGPAPASQASPSASGQAPKSAAPAATKGTAPSPTSATGRPGQATAAKKPAAPTRGNWWGDRALVAVGGAYQTRGSSFSESYSYDQYVERATIATSYPAEEAPGFHGSVLVRVWKGLAGGVALTRTSHSTTGSINGTIPHPFYFDRMRAVTASAPVSHGETAVHAQVAWVVPVGKSMLLSLSGGPSYFSVSQSLVESAPFTESYPYDSAALSTPVVTEPSKSAVGFNVGADFGWFFTRTIGVGAGVRYARARIEYPLHDATVGIDAGGAQAVVGLRVRVPPGAPKKAAPPKPSFPPKRD